MAFDPDWEQLADERREGIFVEQSTGFQNVRFSLKYVDSAQPPKKLHVSPPERPRRVSGVASGSWSCDSYFVENAEGEDVQCIPEKATQLDT